MPNYPVRKQSVIARSKLADAKDLLRTSMLVTKFIVRGHFTHAGKNALVEFVDWTILDVCSMLDKIDAALNECANYSPDEPEDLPF